jgi:hypothetical protein
LRCQFERADQCGSGARCRDAATLARLGDCGEGGADAGLIRDPAQCLARRNVFSRFEPEQHGCGGAQWPDRIGGRQCQLLFKS